MQQQQAVPPTGAIRQYRRALRALEIEHATYAARGWVEPARRVANDIDGLRQRVREELMVEVSA